MVDSNSNGWYAGDCLDESDFSSFYGYVNFDCGDNCYAEFLAGGSGSTGTDNFYYKGCYYDSYGAIDINKANLCNLFAE